MTMDAECITLIVKLKVNFMWRTYIIVSWTATVAALAAGSENNNMQVVFKNCVPFTNCMTEINNTQIDNAKDIDVVMRMSNVAEYNYSKISDIVQKHQVVYDNTISMNQF